MREQGGLRLRRRGHSLGWSTRLCKISYSVGIFEPRIYPSPYTQTNKNTNARKARVETLAAEDAVAAVAAVAGSGGDGGGAGNPSNLPGSAEVIQG